jgi:hypothetical protein
MATGGGGGQASLILYASSLNWNSFQSFKDIRQNVSKLYRLHVCVDNARAPEGTENLLIWAESIWTGALASIIHAFVRRPPGDCQKEKVRRVRESRCSAVLCRRVKSRVENIRRQHVGRSATQVCRDAEMISRM